LPEVLVIQVQIDEKACRGCEICIDACPTQVFAFDQAKRLPEVKKPTSCFGCLACAEQCPANAIQHQGVPQVINFYHDPYALALASKLTGNGPAVAQADAAAVKKGIDDLGVRLLSLAAVLKATLSSGLPAVGTFAGRTLAAQLPRYQPPKTTEEVFELAKRQFAPAWDLEFKPEGDTLHIGIKTCFLRELCAKQQIELGGDLCTLFFNYLAGYLGRMGKMRLRLADANRSAELCTYNAKIYA
jgi:NAD-dependent dihydropyrimidine dehydrogenase PreA subunit